MMDKIKALYTKYGDILRYLIIGGIATLLDIICFALLNGALGLHYQLAKFIAWVIVVAFAFWGNKYVVFRTKTDDGTGIWRELASFVAMRVVTLLVSALLLYLQIDVLHWDENLSNILCNVVIVVLNYILSKLVVFRQSPDK